MNKRIQEIWKKIELWDDVCHDASLGSYLNAPATEKSLGELTERLGVALPSDYLDSLRVHDGTVDWTTKFLRGYLLSSSLVLRKLGERRKVASDLDDVDQRDGMYVNRSLSATGPVKSVFWSQHWIPIHATDWSVTCFDFDPAEGGTVGQIVEVGWEGGWVKVVADNYLEFLQMCAEQLPAPSNRPAHDA